VRSEYPTTAGNSATGVVAAIMNVADEVTTTERARTLLARIRAVDAKLRCYVAIDEDAVLREAARLDAVPAAERGPLHGTTLAVKDIIDVAGLPTRAGSSFFRRDPERDAPVVAALRAAGALVVGKTNTHEFAWGITTENPHFGRTANPWDPSRIVGGSSGGSGAAVAAGLADIALGSDTLGSIRIPAALNGISGLRPATGALSLDDIFPLALGLDTVGPFARDLATVRQAYTLMGGGDVPRVAVGRVCRLRGGAWEGIEAPVSASLDAAAVALRAAGIEVDDVTWWDDALVPAVATVQQRAVAEVHRPFFSRHREEYGEDVRARVAHALTVGEDAERDARAAIARARSAFDAAVHGYQLALAPSVGREAPVAPAPSTFRAETIPLETLASGFGLPVAAIPIGFGPAHMPLGVQVIAVNGAVSSAFALGEAYQHVTDWHKRTPPGID
jgi:aspartyl-tRNA(Asn)/glutamyl-tRNA(Gln) amidotransferase subunit A